MPYAFSFSLKSDASHLHPLTDTPFTRIIGMLESIRRTQSDVDYPAFHIHRDPSITHFATPFDPTSRPNQSNRNTNMSAPTPKCQGFILAHNHPSAAPETPKDPYAVVQCPEPPIVPDVLSDNCALSKKKNSCAKARYCAAHLCGSCKKAQRVESKNVSLGEDVRVGQKADIVV